MMSAEAFVKYASRHYNKEFGKFKVYFDITLSYVGRNSLSFTYTRYSKEYVRGHSLQPA